MVNHGYVRQVVGLDFREFAWDLNGCLYGIGWDFTINHEGSFSTNTPWRHQTPVSAATEINRKKCEFSSHVSLPLANHYKKGSIHDTEGERATKTSGPPAIKRS